MACANVPQRGKKSSRKLEFSLTLDHGPVTVAVMSDANAALRAILISSLLSASLAGAAQAGGTGQSPAPAASGVYSDYLTGRFAENVANPQIAAADFMRALAIQPNNPALLQEALIASLMAGTPDAVALARRLPGNVVAGMLLGGEAARSGDWQSAVQRFTALPQDGAMHLLRPLLIAWAEQGAGRTDSALRGLDALIPDQQYGTLYALHAALIADLAQRTAEATRLYHAVEAQDGAASIGAARLIASFDARQGQRAAALHILNAAAETMPLVRIALPAMAADLQQRPIASALDGIAGAYVGLAAALRADEQDQFAMVLLRLALTLRPDLTTARMLAADILEGQNNFSQALDVLAPVAESDPLNAVVRLRRAELDSRLGQEAEAMAQLQDLARAYPTSSLPDSEAGDILRADGNFSGAAQAYERATARIGTPSQLDWPLFYERGVAYDQSGEWTKAQADFELALKLSPNQPVVLNYLGYGWADRGENLIQARQMLNRASQLRPDDGAITDSLGWIMLHQGEANAAVRTLERAVELEPDDPTINAHLGDAYSAAGRKTEATYQWRRALTLNPLPADAAKLEAKLHETTAQAMTPATSNLAVQR